MNLFRASSFGIRVYSKGCVFWERWLTKAKDKEGLKPQIFLSQNGAAIDAPRLTMVSLQMEVLFQDLSKPCSLVFDQKDKEA